MYFRGHSLIVSSRDKPQNLSFRSPTYGTALMQISANTPAAGKNERLERLKILLALVDELFDVFYLSLGNAKHAFLKKFRRGG